MAPALGGGGVGAGAGGAEEQPVKSAAIIRLLASKARAGFARRNFMLIFMLEAFAVLLLFVFIIWWTMFSGRENGELQDTADAPDRHPDQP